jgi:hypothetical protein
MASRKRKKRVETPAVGEWFKLLEEHGGSHQAEPVPKGWMTTKEVALAWGLSVSTTTQYLNRMTDQGLVEVREFRVKRNTVRPIPHYKIKPGAVRPGAK